MSEDSIVRTVTSLLARCPKGKVYFTSPKCSDELCPLILLLNGYWRLFPRQ